MSLPVLYLDGTVAMARRDVARLFDGLPYGPEDLAAEAAPVLAMLDAPTARWRFEEWFWAEPE